MKVTSAPHNTKVSLMSQWVQNLLACRSSISPDFQTAVSAKGCRELSTFVQGQSGSVIVITIKIHLRLWNSSLHHSCVLPKSGSRWSGCFSRLASLVLAARMHRWHWLRRLALHLVI